MKKMMGVATVLLLSLAGFTQQQNNYERTANISGSSLTVISNSGRQFSVSVDRYQTYQSNGTGYNNSVQIPSLTAGNHQVTVYEWKQGLFGKQKQTVVYSGDVYTRSGYEMTITLNAFGDAVISERPVRNNDYRRDDRGNRNNDYDRDNRGKRNNDRNNRWNKKRRGQKGCGNDDEEDYRRQRDHD
jgi:hypothetical protein